MQNTLRYESAPRIEKKCSGENILGLGGIEQRIPKRVAFGSNLLML